MDGQIKKRLTDRMKIGVERYGHGVRPGDDTRQWGTARDDWFEMAEEELLDAIMYINADYHREFGLEKELKPWHNLTCELSNKHEELVETICALLKSIRRNNTSSKD
jgi:hypothetical protein